MITVNIKVGSGDTAITKNVAGLKVQLATDQEAISDIINLLQEGIAKLTQPLILPNDVPNNASQAQAIINTELDTALKKEGIVLQGNPGGKGINPTGDWSHITYSGAIPQEGKPATNQISIIVNFGKDTQSLQNTNFKIKRAQTNKEQVEAIEGKIKNTDIIVPQGTNKDVTNKQTRAFLEGELKNLNPELEGDPGNGVQAPTGDFKKIFFTGGELEAGQPVTINIILISQDIPASKYGPSFSKIITNIQVTLAQSNQQIIDALTGEIINKTITLPYGKNYDPTNPDDKAIIFNNLKNANPLFQQALANLQNEVTTSLAGGMINMETTQATGLIFTLGYQDVTKDTNINIKINNTWDRVTSVDPSNSQPVQLGSTEYYATRKGLYYSLTQDGKT